MGSHSLIAGTLTAVGISLVAACSGLEPSADVTTGSGLGSELDKNLSYFDFTLPEQAAHVSWVKALDWDSAHLYLSFRTDAAGVRHVLGVCEIKRSEFRPATGTSGALPASSGWARLMPGDVKRWEPASWESAISFEGEAPACGASGILIGPSEQDARQVFVYLFDY